MVSTLLMGWLKCLFLFFCYQGGKKLERARDLFEQCLENCPPKFAKGRLQLDNLILMPLPLSLSLRQSNMTEVVLTSAETNKHE